MNVHEVQSTCLVLDRAPSENASRAMDNAKPLVYNGDEYSLSVSKAGSNKSAPRTCTPVSDDNR